MNATQHFVGRVDAIGDRIEGADSTASHLQLARGALASFGPCAPIQLRVIDGELWITQEGDGRDVIVRPGMSYLSARHGKVVVQALDRATIEVRRLCEG
jgi:hypothetical protein